ncbi:GNAT family N-acetyltransferase [Devosia sp.]|uniref:GNAT family N-acetyltransferase n=1 Tax=Devosia sp. TaxID=1871048 RepID=UPI00273302EF|nr:GNAT family N-acetyltransferase [Devosia sp.]MDP2779170.1 GNAT family N-acetyltransferase [Devosia sp.]
MGLPDASVLERAGLAAWPGIEVDWDGGWVRRAANGYTKRANSVQCLDPSDEGDVDARIANAVDWFSARGLPPVFRMTPLAGPGLAIALDGLGWRSIDASYLFAMQLAAGEPDPRGQIYKVRDPAFLAVQQRLSGYDDERLGKLDALLAAMTVAACGVVLHDDDGAPVATALMAIADGIVVTGNVVTDASRRRQGHAGAMMRTGHAWAHAAGARVAALNVQADNLGAQALYQSLGYAHQYDYHYRLPGTA